MNEGDIYTVDDILPDVFRKSQFEVSVNWRTILYSLCLKRDYLIVLGCLLLFGIYVGYYGVRFKTIARLLSFLYVVDFVFTWMRLLNGKQVELMRKMNKKPLPEECDPSKMQLPQYTRYLLLGLPDECQQNYGHRYLFFEVSPSVVIGTQLEHFIVTPMTHFENALGSLNNAILSNFWWFGPIVFSFILACVLLISGKLITGTPYKIKQNVYSNLNRAWEHLLGILKRPAIRDVPEKDETNIKKKNL